MTIRILSDLHREFGETDIPSGDADLVILAGDISTKLNGLPWMREFCSGTPKAFVCGNHEFYGAKVPRVAEKLRSATERTELHVLENEFFEVGDWAIFGCTLWTDLELVHEWRIGAAYAGDSMNDYKRIRNSAKGYRRLLPVDTRNIHLQSLQKMSSFLNGRDPTRSIIVSHHAPSLLSLPERRWEMGISCAYASDLTEFILHHQPALWVHGHIHHNSDYTIGNTRILANPQGYPDEINPDFDANFSIEL